MDRSLPRSIPYMRNAVAFCTTPALANDSAATRSVAPRGTMTRTSPVPDPRHESIANTTTAAAPAINRRVDRAALRRLDIGLGARSVLVHGGERRHSQRLLEQHRRRERIHIALPSSRAASHVVDRAKRARRRESLVEEGYGQYAPLFEKAKK